MALPSKLQNSRLLSSTIDAEGAGLELGVDVVGPEGGRFEDVAVYVDNLGLSWVYRLSGLGFANVGIIGVLHPHSLVGLGTGSSPLPSRAFVYNCHLYTGITLTLGPLPSRERGLGLPFGGRGWVGNDRYGRASPRFTLKAHLSTSRGASG